MSEEEHTDAIEETTAVMGLSDESLDKHVQVQINLPTFADVNCQKVLQSVKSVFAGFDFSGSINYANKFKDTEALANYANESLEAIKTLNKKTMLSDLHHMGASMARFWYMAKTLDMALAAGSYGTNAANRLATAMGVSVSYVYQIRMVATRLTETECYLMGMRGVDSTRLRRVATVKDDEIRHAMVAAFINEYSKAGAQRDQIEANAALDRAIVTANNSNTVELGTSLLGDGEDKDGDAEEYPEYKGLFKQVGYWSGLLKKLDSEETVDALVNAAGDFFIPEEFGDKSAALDKAQDAVQDLLDRIARVQQYMNDIKQALDSIQAMSAEE